MNLVILGTGALARLCYVRFHEDQPLMIGRHFGPFHFVDQRGQSKVYHPRWIRWEDPMPWRPDVVLVAVKWPAMTLVATWLQHWAEEALVVSLLNGMGQEGLLLGPVRPHQLSMASTTDAISRHDQPKEHIWQATLTHRGETYLTQTGHPSETLLTARARTLHLAWTWEDPLTIQKRRWSKLIANSVINPLTALAARTNGEILHMPLWHLARPLADEAETVARYAGIEIQCSLGAIEELAQATHNNRSSMLQDVLGNHPTEIDAITGYLISQAQSYGIAVPTHQAVYTLIKQISVPSD